MGGGTSGHPTPTAFGSGMSLGGSSPGSFECKMWSCDASGVHVELLCAWRYWSLSVQMEPEVHVELLWILTALLPKYLWL
ncbi:unnamed protein product [Urochloa humidicola]